MSDRSRAVELQCDRSDQIGPRVGHGHDRTQVSTLESQATEIYSEQIDKAQEYLLKMAKPLCTLAGATKLPPLHEINHTIPLVDENKVYTWRPS